MAEKTCAVCGGSTDFVAHSEHLCLRCGDSIQSRPEALVMVAGLIARLRKAGKDLTQWKSMDCVPKDETHILLLVNGQAIEGWWSVPKKPPALPEEVEGGWGVVWLPYHGCGCCGKGLPEPSAWMPLPPKPKSCECSEPHGGKMIGGWTCIVCRGDLHNHPRYSEEEGGA